MNRYMPYTGRPKKRKLLWALLALVIAGVLCFSALLGLVLWGSHDELVGDPQIMIVLGCRVMSWGPSTLLQDRMDEALAYLEEHPDMTVVPSGGQGADEPYSEASAIRDYLVEQGVDPERILMEENSFNTWENLTNSLALLEEEGHDLADGVVVVSNGFHLTRVRMLWGRLTGGPEGLSTLAAPTSHLPSLLKMYIREPIGLVKSFLLDHDLF